MTKQSGFTLIELLIAVSILSLLMFTGTFSYSLMSNRWDKELGDFSSAATQSRHLNLIQSLLDGVHTFIVTDEKQVPSFFFIGDSESLLAVSRGGLYSGDYSEIFRLTGVEKSSGKFDLLYQSTSTENILLTGTEQNVEFRKELILFKDLDKVEFSYLGWESSDKKSQEGETVVDAQWFSRYSGIDNQIMPIKFQLTLTKNQQPLTLPIYLDENSEMSLSPYRNDGD